MGTHPIFESDFDCLTDCRKFTGNSSMAHLGRRAVIGIKYTVRHTVQLAFYGTAGVIVGVTGLTLFENQLPLDYRNRIDQLKTQLLCNDIFEEHSIFFEENSGKETLAELKKKFFDWLVAHVFKKGRSVEWYEVFFQSYGAGINDSGIKRISKLAIQRELPLNFAIALNNVYRLPSHDVIIDQENLKNKISDLLNDVEISNECIGTVRSAFINKLRTIDRLEASEEFDELEFGQLSSDLPVVRMDKIPLERQFRDFVRIIAQIFYSEDYLVKQILLDRGILDLLSQVAVCRPELTVDVFDIVSQLSSNPEYEKFTSNRNIILQAINGLVSPNVEMRSMSYKIIHNLNCESDKIAKSIFIGYPKLADQNHDFNLVFIHGLLGKSHRTWRSHDDMIGSDGHSYCWPIEWLPRTLEFRSLKPRVILMAYPTALSQYGQECVDEELTIEKRASKLMKDLNQLDLSKPTIFVGHSMGGLLIKSIITQASTVPDYASIIESIRGFVFYSTPHFGSFLASAASAPVFKNVLLPSPDVTSLKKQSSYLQKLNRDFLELVQKQKIDILSFYEELPTKIALKGW